MDNYVRLTHVIGEVPSDNAHIIQGKDMSKSIRRMIGQTSKPLVQGTITNPTGIRDTRPPPDRKPPHSPCTNKYCKGNKKTHPFEKCFAYKGGSEGVYPKHWIDNPKFAKTLAACKKDLAKLKKSGGVDTNSSSSTEISMDGRLARMKVDMLHCAGENPDKTMGFLNNTCAEMNSAASGSRWG